ncbi:hypothetical protein BpHYR1_016115 [Brachionus plicatilis]|uniref:Uncharacterized protein n=1 Tax=Brachionus plicatilis TaxID=10195 RepID=A0A3M7QRE8_BRAPC|nr:hypothetical protein BpHYR1_016115 [Brachionus plicatilis]
MTFKRVLNIYQMEPSFLSDRRNKRLVTNSKNVTFSRLRKSRHSVGNCQQLTDTNSEKPQIIKSKSLMSDLSHLETKSNGTFNNYSINNKPVQPIIQFPDEEEPNQLPKPKPAPKPLKTILKNPLPVQNYQLPRFGFANVTVTRETEVAFPDDRSRTFNSLSCDASCSSGFSHAYVHKPKSEYLIEPKRRWSYDYVKREPSDIVNPDIDSPYLVTDSKMLNPKKKCMMEECKSTSFIFSTLTSCAEVIQILFFPVRYLFIDHLIFYLSRNVNEDRKKKKINQSANLEYEVIFANYIRASFFINDLNYLILNSCIHTINCKIITIEPSQTLGAHFNAKKDNYKLFPSIHEPDLSLKILKFK